MIIPFSTWGVWTLRCLGSQRLVYLLGCSVRRFLQLHDHRPTRRIREEREARSSGCFYSNEVDGARRKSGCSSRTRTCAQPAPVRRERAHTFGSGSGSRWSSSHRSARTCTGEGPSLRWLCVCACVGIFNYRDGVCVCMCSSQCGDPAGLREHKKVQSVCVVWLLITV